MNHQAGMQHAVPSAPASVELRDVMLGILRRWRLIVMSVAFATMTAVAFVMVATPRYTTETQLLVENLETPFNRSDKSAAVPGRIEDRDVLSQVEVLKSRDLALRVIKELKLNGHAEFDPLKHGTGVVSGTLASLGFGTDPTRQSAEQRALTALHSGLSVFQIPQSKVIVIRFSASDAKIAADVANTLAKFYVHSTREVQTEPTSRARDWLSKQIEDLRAKVVASEIAIEKFRGKAGLQRGLQSGTLNTQELSELNSQIILAKAARSQAEARAKAVRDLLAKRGNIESSAEVLSSPLIQRLREQQVALKRQTAQLSTTYLPNHPRIISVRRELRDLGKQIRSEILKIAQGLEQQVKVAASREASLRASLATLKVKASRSGTDDVKLRSLEREATANRKLLETFLAQFTDAKSRQDIGAQSGMARIISTAGVPTQPSFPRPGPVVMLALLAGLVFGLGIAFLSELMRAASALPDAAAVPAAAPAVAVAPVVPEPVMPHAAAAPPPQEVSPPAAIQTALPEPAPPVAPIDLSGGPEPAPAGPEVFENLICEVPAVASPETAKLNALSVAGEPQAPYALALRPIASWIASTLQSNKLKRFAVGAMPGSELDTAATAVGIGRLLAGHGIKVLLVDADLSGSGLSLALDREGQEDGLAELLNGQGSATDLIVRDTASQMHILPAGNNRAAAQTQLLSQRMISILDACDSAFDIVFLHDGATLYPAQASSSVIAQTRGALIVAAEAQKGEASALTGALSKAGLVATGFVSVKAPAEAVEDTPQIEAA